MKRYFCIVASALLLACKPVTHTQYPELTEEDVILKTFLMSQKEEFWSLNKQLQPKILSGKHICFSLVDTTFQTLDSNLVKRSLLFPNAKREMVGKLIELNKNNLNMNNSRILDTSFFRATDSNRIFKFYKEFENEIFGLTKDTLFVDGLRFGHPAISNDRRQAVLPFNQFGILFFAVLQKDTLWEIKKLIRTSID